MIEYQKAKFFSLRDQLNSVENSFDSSRIQEEDSGTNFDSLQMKSPATQVNLTAQQHFNNRTIRQSSGKNNITFEENQSSDYDIRKERSLLSPGIERQFSELDQFLKQTYDKHGVYELIRSFVDMEDQLVSTFEYLKKLQRKKNHIESSATNRVRCFEEINEIDQFSFEAEQNIIHQFLYNLQSFFIPSQNQIKDQPDEIQKSNANFSFSQNKPNLETSMITGKKNHHIHTSRSKYIVNAGLNSKRHIFSDEKMIQSINLSKPIIPLKFEESSFKIPQPSWKKTNSQIVGQESLESQNIYLGNQQELLKTIFELRHQIFILKQSKNGQNGTSSQNSSFYMDGSLSEHNFRCKQNQKQQTFLLQNSKEKQSFKLINGSDSKQKYNQIIPNFTHPIVIKEDISNQDSPSIQESTFKLSMLESVEEESDKENNINSMNIQDMMRQKSSKLKIFCKEKASIQKQIAQTESNMLQSYASQLLTNHKKKNQSECLRNAKSENDHFIDKILDDFKHFFKVQMEIQLILLKVIRKKLTLQRSVFVSFQRMIDWYSAVKIKRATKNKSVETFTSECLGLKTEILETLKRSIGKCRLSKAM